MEALNSIENLIEKLKIKFKLFFEVLFCLCTITISLCLVSLAVKDRVEHRNYSFVTAILLTCISSRMYLHFIIHTVGYKLLGKEHLKRKRFGINCTKYIILFLMNVIFSLQFYMVFLFGQYNQQLKHLSLSPTLLFYASCLFVPPLIVLTLYFVYYIKYFTKGFDLNNA